MMMIAEQYVTLFLKNMMGTFVIIHAITNL